MGPLGGGRFGNAGAGRAYPPHRSRAPTRRAVPPRRRAGRGDPEGTRHGARMDPNRRGPGVREMVMRVLRRLVSAPMVALRAASDEGATAAAHACCAVACIALQQAMRRHRPEEYSPRGLFDQSLEASDRDSLNRKRGGPAKVNRRRRTTTEARRIDGSEANRRKRGESKRGESTEARRIDGSEANRRKRGESTEARRIDGSEANRRKRGESMEARRIDGSEANRRKPDGRKRIASHSHTLSPYACHHLSLYK